MRAIFAVILLTAACGDNVAPDDIQFPDTDDNDTLGNDPGSEDPTGESRIAPQLCDVRYFGEFRPGLDIDLAVAPIPSGTAIFAVSRYGGPIRAFAHDHRGRGLVDKAGVEVATGSYRGVAASFIDERLVTAALDSSTGEVVFDMHRLDLGAKVELGRAPGSLLADQAMLPNPNGRVAAVGTDDRINSLHFDHDWRTDTVVTEVGRALPESIAATKYLSNAAVIWSTADSCTVQQLDGTTNDAIDTRPFACQGARISIDEKFNTGHVVFEQDGKLMRAPVSVDNKVVLGDATVLVEEGYAPRIVYDGHRYWVSYLDARGFPVIGFLDGDETLQTIGLQSLRPMDEAQELVVINGQVWFYEVDRFGLSGERFCAVDVGTGTPPRF